VPQTTIQPPIRHLVTLAAIASLLIACGGVSHIRSYTPKQRDYRSSVDLTTRAAETSNGSLFSSTHQGAYLFADQRAARVGDIVTINVVEDANAERGALTDLTRNANASLQISAFLGLVRLLESTIDPANLLSGGQGSDFIGRGSTSRTEHVRATVPAIVKQVLPNGNLFIEGHRVILVNDEEHHFYVSGLVRPFDIAEDNSIDSGRIADAEIEFTGRGIISEKQRPGWLQRGLDLIAPF